MAEAPILAVDSTRLHSRLTLQAAALGQEAFSAAWEAGRAMTTEQVIAFAREGLDDIAGEIG